MTAPKKPGKAVTPTDPNFYKELLDHMSDGVYFVDRDRRILYWNEGAFRLTGYKSEELVGQCCQDNTLRHVDAAGHNLCQDGCPLTASISDGTLHEAPLFLRHKQGRRVPVSVRVQPIRAADGSIVGAVEVFSDNSRAAAMTDLNKELRRLSLLDPLTEVGNRRFLEQQLMARLNEQDRYGWRVGVLFLDIDRFKDYNDIYGHDAGNAMLQTVSGYFQANIRTSDIACRYGGDEFLLVLTEATLEDTFRRVEAIREGIRRVVNGNIRAGAFPLLAGLERGVQDLRPGGDIVRHVQVVNIRGERQRELDGEARALGKRRRRGNQPGDGLDSKDFIRRLGPFDDWVINWGYRVIPHATSPEAERTVLNGWYVNQKGPMPYRYVPQQYGSIDPRRPYVVNLPSGRSMAVFFFDSPTSRAVAFEGLLTSGEDFAERLLGTFDESRGPRQLVNVATDGETYGHHHRFGDMALAYVLERFEDEHEVVVAGSARAALDLLDAGERFDVLCSDLMMPDMDGAALHAEVARRDPVLARCTVFLTGGAYTQEALASLEAAHAEVLEKPFELSALRDLVSRLLSSARAG